jgi:hypothetical protein
MDQEQAEFLEKKKLKNLKKVEYQQYLRKLKMSIFWIFLTFFVFWYLLTTDAHKEATAPGTLDKHVLEDLQKSNSES